MNKSMDSIAGKTDANNPFDMEGLMDKRHDLSDEGDDDDFPALNKTGVPTPLNQNPKMGSNVASTSSVMRERNNGTKPVVNAWAKRSPKIFRNSGLGGKLEYVAPKSEKLVLTREDALPMQSVWGWSLIGQYVGFHPGKFMINDLRWFWGVKSVYTEEKNWMIFKFETEEDKDKVLKGGPYFIHGRPLILRNVPETFAFNDKDLATMPLWVPFFGLPKHHWTSDVLRQIASYVGEPLFMDKMTEERAKGRYARLLIDVNFAKPIVRGVPIELYEGHTVNCKIEIENEPCYCPICSVFGHEQTDCAFKNKRTDVGINARKSNVSKSIARREQPAGNGGALDNTSLKHPIDETNKEDPMSRTLSANASNNGTGKGTISSESGGNTGVAGDNLVTSDTRKTQIIDPKTSENKSDTQGEIVGSQNGKTPSDPVNVEPESEEENDSSLDRSSSEEDGARVEED